MTAFEFTTVLFGFVVALGLARVLGGVADLIRCWRQLLDPILLSLWFTLLILLPIGYWISLWRFSDSSSINLAQILLVFQGPVLIYIATRLLIPSESEFSKIDERYNTIRAPFALCIGLSMLIGPSLGVIASRQMEMIYRLMLASLQISLHFVQTRKYDYFVSAASVVLFLAFIVQYRSVIGEA